MSVAVTPHPWDIQEKLISEKARGRRKEGMGSGVRQTRLDRWFPQLHDLGQVLNLSERIISCMRSHNEMTTANSYLALCTRYTLHVLLTNSNPQTQSYEITQPYLTNKEEEEQRGYFTGSVPRHMGTWWVDSYFCDHRDDSQWILLEQVSLLQSSASWEGQCRGKNFKRQKVHSPASIKHSA